MKPDWKDAPEWAQWLAMDSDGSWWWFADKPEKYNDFDWRSDARFQKASVLGWDYSLESRP